METVKELRKICQTPKEKNRSLSDVGYLLHRRLSIYITKAILAITGSKIVPNYLSVFNILFGIIVLLLIAANKNPLFFPLLLLLFYFSFLLDKVDGEIARYKKTNTLRGTYLDEIYHLFVQNGLILAVAVNRDLLFLGIAGFILFLLIRYIHKIRYSMYAARYKSNRDKYSIKEGLGRIEKSFIGFLNIFPLKLCSLARRHDIFLFLVFILSIFCFNLTTAWLWFLLFWLTMLMIYFLRFLLLHYFFIDEDIQSIDKNKL